MFFRERASRFRKRSIPRFPSARWNVNPPAKLAGKAPQRDRVGPREILSVCAAQYASWLMPITLFGTFIVLCLIAYAFTRFLQVPPN